MGNDFLEALNLRALLAPETEEAFLSDYWEKAPLIIPRNDPGYYGDLFTLEDFDREVATQPASLRTSNARSKKNYEFAGPVATGDIESILGEMQDGTTLILNGLNLREPKLARLCRVLAQETGHSFQTNLYLTPGGGQGFSAHYDNHDVFILQVLGFKHWQIEKTRRRLPSRGENRMPEEEGREIRGEHYSFTLNQGDVVYIPRGFVHAAQCGPEPSLHITLGLTPFTWSNLLNAVIRAEIHKHENLTNALPMGFLRGDGHDLVDGLRKTLMSVADEANLRAVVDRFRDETVTRYPLDIRGRVSGFFGAKEIRLDDKVGPRPGIVFRLKNGDDSVRLHFGGRNIDFPAFLKEPLDFALNTTEYSVSDIAGDLEDSEKVFVVNRLMQEGLLVRR